MGKSHFDTEAVAKAMVRGKETNPKTEIVPGVSTEKLTKKESKIDNEFKQLRKASKKSQNAILRHSCPEGLKALEDTTTAFSITIDGNPVMFHVVAVHGKAGVSFPADVVVRYTSIAGENKEVRFETRPWVNHDKGWRFVNIATFPQKGDKEAQSFLATMKISSGKCKIVLSTGYSVENTGKSALDILTRSIYHNHIKALRSKKKK